MSGVNGYKISLTSTTPYQADLNALNIKPIGSPDGAATVASTTDDQILDLSDNSKLQAELTSQDLSKVKTIKVGNEYLAIPSPAMLKQLVDQLKQVCLSEPGDKLKNRLEGISITKTANTATTGAASTNLVFTVGGVEPDDGLKSSDRNLDFRRRAGGVHLLQAGDNLTNIAKALYGEANADENAKLLAKYNGFDNPNQIPAGQTITLIRPDLMQLPAKQKHEEFSDLYTSIAIDKSRQNPVTPPTTPTVPPTPLQPNPTGETTPPTAPTTPTAPATRGAEFYSENPPTLKGFMDFIGPDAISLLEQYEKRADTPYRDGAKSPPAPPGGYLTTGIGHLVKPGETSVLLDQRRVNLAKAKLTNPEIDKLFYRDFEANAFAVIRDIKPEVLHQLNRNQLLALASLAFNIGPGEQGAKRGKGFAPSPLAAALNGPGTIDERLNRAAKGFSRYIYSGGEKMGGLMSRRIGERILLLRPDIAPQDIPGYKRPELDKFIKALNADGKGFPQIDVSDIWGSGRKAPRKKHK